MVGYWRRARSRRHRRRSESRRRPPDSFFHDSSLSSNSNSGDRHYLRNARTVFICGCRIDTSFTPRGPRSDLLDSRRASLIAEVNTSSLPDRGLHLLEFDPRGPGDPMEQEGEAVAPRERLSRGTRRRLELCEFNVYATPSTPNTRSRTTRRRRSNSNNGRVRVSFKGSSFEYESSISSSRGGDFVYSSTTMLSAPMLEPQPQFETPPPESMSDIDEFSDRGRVMQLRPLASDLTLGAFPGPRPRSRISVGCNGWITADTPPKSVAKLSEIVEGIASPEQSQFSVGVSDDTSDTISKYAADSFRGLAPVGINFDLILIGHSSSRDGELERTSVDSASLPSAHQRRRVSPAGSFSLDDVSRQSDVPYRITEDAALLQILPNKSDKGDKKAATPPATPPATTRSSKVRYSLLTFRYRRSRQQQPSTMTPPVLQTGTAFGPLRPSIIHIDCHT